MLWCLTLSLLWAGPGDEETSWEDASSDEAGWGDATGDEAGWGDEDSDAAGFGSPDLAPVETTPTGPFQAGGRAGMDLAFWVEDRGLSPLAMARPFVDVWFSYNKGPWRAKLGVHNEVDFAIYGQRAQWDDATVEAYGHQVVLREAYVGADVGRVSVTLGRQVLSLGEGRILSSQDVIAPRDLREPATVDLDRLRLPVGMLRVAGTVDGGRAWPGEHAFELAVVPEAYWGYRSPPKGPYGSFEGLLGNKDLVADVTDLVDIDQVLTDAIVSYEHLQPMFRLDQIQAVGRWTWRGKGVDLGLMGGTVLDQRGLLVTPPLDDLVTNANTGVPTALGIDHQRYELLGTFGAGQAGPLLLRWEATYGFRTPVNVGQLLRTVGLVTSLDVRAQRADMVSVLFGMSWSGWEGATIDIDLTKGFFIDEPADLLYRPDVFSWSFRGRKPFLRDRFYIELTSVGWGFTLDYGWLGRGTFGVIPADGLEVFVGAVSYAPGSERGLLLGLDRHDRIFSGVRYSF